MKTSIILVPLIIKQGAVTSIEYVVVVLLILIQETFPVIKYSRNSNFCCTNLLIHFKCTNILLTHQLFLILNISQQGYHQT